VSVGERERDVSAQARVVGRASGGRAGERCERDSASDAWWCWGGVEYLFSLIFEWWACGDWGGDCVDGFGRMWQCRDDDNALERR
jgi:hypothetical protein